MIGETTKADAQGCKSPLDRLCGHQDKSLEINPEFTGDRQVAVRLAMQSDLVREYVAGEGGGHDGEFQCVWGVCAAFERR